MARHSNDLKRMQNVLWQSTDWHTNSPCTSGSSLQQGIPPQPGWSPVDSTPIVSETAADKLAGNPWEVGDKYGIWRFLIERVNAVTLASVASIIVVLFIFYQDNAAGRISCWKGLLWTITKSIVACVFLILLAVIGHYVNKRCCNKQK